MADDYAGERSEQATPRRRQEARERGQVARSPDLSAAVALLAGLWLLHLWGPDLMDALLALQGRWLARLARPGLDDVETVRLVTEGMAAFALAAAPVVLGLLAAGVAVNLLQVGLLFTGVPLLPQWERVNPVTGLGRLFSGGALMRFVMSALKLAAIGTVAWYTVSEHLPMLDRLMAMPVTASFATVGSVVMILGTRIALALLLLGLLDYGWQRFDFERGLRMTKQELKEEMKRMEGDPMIRARRLQLARQLARQRMMKKVPEADVVITNPTELAVAIRYDADAMAAPVVVAKGARLWAQRIREVAAAAGVPIVERKPLAQALYKRVEVGQPIPKELFQAVSEVLSFLYQLDRSRAERWGVSPAGA